MEFTGDELTVLIEAQREYRLRQTEPSRLLVSDALIYRLGAELINQAKADYSEGTETNGSSLSG